MRLGMDLKSVVFKTDTRVTTGTRVALFKAGVPRAVHPEIAQAAMGMGARDATAEVEIMAIPDEETVAPDFKEPLAVETKVTRRRRKKKARPDPVIIAETVEFITKFQPEWATDAKYDINKQPRMSLFADAVLDLTPALRDAAWDIYISGQVGG